MLDGTVAEHTRTFRPVEPEFRRVGISSYISTISNYADRIVTFSGNPRTKQDTENILNGIEDTVETFLENYNRDIDTMNQDDSLYTKDEIRKYQKFAMLVLEEADKAHLKARQGCLFICYANNYHRNKRTLKGFESENGLVMRSSFEYKQRFERDS